MFRPIVFILILTMACAPVRADDAAMERGAELLGPFKKELKEALIAGLGTGPEEAIGACKEQAPAIASSLSVDGVIVGRTSHRLRNPDNAAPDWVSPVLAAYLEAESARAPQVVVLADGRVGYVEPIVMQPLCLTCHGETLSDDIATRIEREYPRDEATGFAVGELRGVFWVEYPEND